MSLCSCEQSPTGDIIDKSNHTFSFKTAPERVVCLQASLGSCYQLAGGSFIGISDDYEDYNLDIGEASIIGSTKKPNFENIVELQPDFIIYSSKIANELSVAERLMNMNFKCFDASIDNFNDYLFCLEQFTKITGRSDLYKTNGLDVQNSINTIINNCPNTNNPKIAFVRCYSSGYNVLSSGNIVTDMLKDLKTINVAPEGTDLTAEVSLESVIEGNPDFIFYTFMGTSNIEKSRTYFQENFLNKEDIKNLDAVKNNMVFELPTDKFHFKPNAKWAESYQYLYDIIYKEN